MSNENKEKAVVEEVVETADNEVTENQETNESKENAEAIETVEETVVELTIEEQYEVKLAELQAKLAEEENRHLRLRADYDNLNRRTKLDREAAEKYRAQKLLTDLLPVLDNFERALQVEVASEEAQTLYKGIEMVYRTLIEATEKEGLEVIPAVGEAFDPTIHQAVMQEQNSELEAGAVIRELQKGYKLKDRVLRPAMVSVNE